MKRKTNVILKKIFDAFRLVLFLPAAISAGNLVRYFFGFLVQITTFGKIDPDNYFSGSAIPLLIGGWLVTYFVSYFIKPKFISSKAFIISWLFILGFIAAGTIANIIDPPFFEVYGGMSYPIHKDIWKFIIPTGIFIWFVKDKDKGLYSLDEKWLRNDKRDDKN
tara:strand:- start:683 stop:1174 length:492 start_codon:yes stop_codon:yes gene_type:complete